jgi:hypothetical protein
MKADDRTALRTRIWYTADGRDLQVRRMTTSHIRACLEMIERRYDYNKQRGWRARYMMPLNDELMRRYEVRRRLESPA